jgi:Putative auto-transporter adhesin, head GIN domain
MNTKLLKAVLGLTIVMLLVSACGMIPTVGSRNLISETRAVSGYDRVDVSGGGSLEIIQDGTESLTIETDDNMMQYVTAEVRGGTLYVGLNSSMRTLLPSRLILTLHVKDLSGITTSGSWEINSAALKTVNLDIVISGSGKVVVNSLTLVKLSATISGSGGLTLVGKADNQTINISGSGKYLAGDLRTLAASVSISGSGNATVWAKDTLTVRVSGSSNVSYYGSPQVSVDHSGSGSIHNLGVK